MNISVKATALEFDRAAMRVELDDGRTLSVPLAWFPRLARATPEQRANWRIGYSGNGLHWDELDEDISVEGLLAGRGDDTGSAHTGERRSRANAPGGAARWTRGAQGAKFAASPRSATQHSGPAMRPSGRAPGEMRAVALEPGFAKHAEGSCLVRFGDTHVLCAATVEDRVPPFLRHSGRGWVTAEYGMLPRSTHSRTEREAARGRQSGRTLEIQRLIGRALRAVTLLDGFGERQVRIDCDVIQADGGTRTAAITGSQVALHLAFDYLARNGLIESMPLTGGVAAVSCGLYRGAAVVDLDYAEDSDAEADANFVFAEGGALVEVQATAERAPFGRAAFGELMDLAAAAAERLFALQRAAIESALRARDAAAA